MIPKMRRPDLRPVDKRGRFDGEQEPKSKHAVDGNAGLSTRFVVTIQVELLQRRFHREENDAAKSTKNCAQVSRDCLSQRDTRLELHNLPRSGRRPILSKLTMPQKQPISRTTQKTRPKLSCKTEPYPRPAKRVGVRLEMTMMPVFIPIVHTNKVHIARFRRFGSRKSWSQLTGILESASI